MEDLLVLGALLLFVSVIVKSPSVAAAPIPSAPTPSTPRPGAPRHPFIPQYPYRVEDAEFL